MKKIIVIVAISIVVVVMSVTAFAKTSTEGMMSRQSNGNTTCRSGTEFGFMTDEKGNFLSEGDFKEKLDKAIKDGNVAESDREFYINMFERCISDGGKTRGCGRW